MKGDAKLGKVMGRAAANELKKHFRKLNSERANKLGGKRSNFYSHVAASVQNPKTTENKIIVAISHPHIAQRFWGGTIRPTKTKLIAVPVNKKGYGVYPRIYSSVLAFLPTRRGGVLVEGEEVVITRGKNAGKKRRVPKKGGALIYALVEKISQKKDPSVMPKDQVIIGAMERGLKLIRPGE